MDRLLRLAVSVANLARLLLVDLHLLWVLQWGHLAVHLRLDFHLAAFLLPSTNQWTAYPEAHRLVFLEALYHQDPRPEEALPSVRRHLGYPHHLLHYHLYKLSHRQQQQHHLNLVVLHLYVYVQMI